MENIEIYLNTSWMVLIISNKESKRKFTKFQSKYRDWMTGVSHFSGFMVVKNQGSFCILNSAILSMMTLSQPSLVYSIIGRWLPQFKMPHTDVTRFKGRRGPHLPVCPSVSKIVPRKLQAHVCYSSLARDESYPITGLWVNHSQLA